ncbi:uncharacterized protein LOC119592517 isoform X2 [Penaeus monodon]|uniref:uncharacterized protein LOC119592517 isoform X2 n=1 Tax=Penaeus monodon TaxID=6687 RepID=UPI0018A7A947|nr:uncharacterized protein LOC119592517 isoform X2 [Penaeus monodon]
MKSIRSPEVVKEPSECSWKVTKGTHSPAATRRIRYRSQHLNMATVGIIRLLPSLSLGRPLCTSSSLSARGIGRTLKSLQIGNDVEDLSIEEIDSITNIDQRKLENFSQQIDRDAEVHQRHIRQKTIERKYFRNKGPEEQNLLTWAMKEQLRYLHSTDPDMWTPEALSVAFPITEDGVKKLLKAKWFPRDEAAIEKHDRRVLASWKKHTKGQLGSSQLLKEMLDKKYGVTDERLLQPVNQEDILSTLESLRYEHEEEPYIAKGLRPKNKLPKRPKMKGNSFTSIVNDYETRLQQIRKEKDEKPPQEAVSLKCRDLAEFTAGTPKYEGHCQNVSVASGPRQRGKAKTRSKEMTFSEFMEQKKGS